MGVDAEHGGMVMARLTVIAVPVLTDNYVWLIHDPDERRDGRGRSVALPTPVLRSRERSGWRMTQVLNTHWHPDHTGGNAAIKDATGCTIIAPGRSRAREQGRPNRRRRATVIRVGSAEAGRLGHSRPHRRPHRLLSSTMSGMIFVGDTMFAMGCGRLFEGTAEQMYANPAAHCRASRRRPDLLRARIYARERALRGARGAWQRGRRAHGSSRSRPCATAGQITLPTTVAEERATNPFVRASGCRRISPACGRAKDSFR